jgi:hypothetical protein
MKPRLGTGMLDSVHPCRLSHDVLQTSTSQVIWFRDLKMNNASQNKEILMGLWLCIYIL